MRLGVRLLSQFRRHSMFSNFVDPYKCVKGKSTKARDWSDDQFTAALEASLAQFREKRVRGVWFQVDIQDSRFIQILVAHGFIFHHAKPQYVMMSSWLVEGEPSTLPHYPHMYIGCGGLVVDAQNRVLLMREARGFYLGWKFPGGLADPNESLLHTASREVLEETGVETEGVAILSFRQVPYGKWVDTNDIYFVCVMRPKDENKKEVAPCPHEAADARWFTREEIAALPEEEFHASLRKQLSDYDDWKAQGCRGLTMTTLDSPFKEDQQLYMFAVDYAPLDTVTPRL